MASLLCINYYFIANLSFGDLQLEYQMFVMTLNELPINTATSYGIDQSREGISDNRYIRHLILVF